MGIRPEQVEAAAVAQRAAAADPTPRVRVVAGPGTGKSFTIEERVRWLLVDQGIEDRAIAAVSFTRASAADLQARVQDACARAGREDARVVVRTLHSLALRSLRAAGVLNAYPVDPSVLDQWELGEVFDTEFGHVAGVGSIPRRRDIRVDHETFWNTGVHGQRPATPPPEPPISEDERSRFRGFHRPRTQLYACVLPGEIIQRCVERIEAGLLNIRDLLGIEHLIVDEFQDLNPMDLRFVYGIEAQGVKLFVAGDDDQSLYSFRYADPTGIQDFTDLFDVVGDHVLESCFRCTPAVLLAAETLIRSFGGVGRIPKNHISLYAGSDPPVEGGFGRWRFASGADEARAIAQSCRRMIDAGLAAREIMVLLSNAGALGWQLRNAFEEFGVPFEPARAEHFKNTPEGRALLTILGIVCRPDDYVALRTLLTLRRGVGVGSASKIADSALRQSLNYRDLFYDALPPDLELTPAVLRALEAARDVCSQLGEWGSQDLIQDYAESAQEMIATVLGREPDVYWRDELSGLPDEATLEDTAQLLAAEKDEEKAKVLASIYERLGDDPPEDVVMPDRVRVMTMHGAKGLSATVVFIPALEEEVLPGVRRAQYAGQILEAARMLYVAITRARIACIVSLASSRFIYGQTVLHHPSQFAPHLGGSFTDGGAGMTIEVAQQTVAAAQQL